MQGLRGAGPPSPTRFQHQGADSERARGRDVACGGGGGAFATICNLFSKVYFVTIYLSLKNGKLHHHPPSPQKRKFSKYVAGVVICEGMDGKLGCLPESRAESGEHLQVACPCPAGGRRGSCQSRQPPSQNPRGFWACPVPGIVWAGGKERGRGSDVFAASQSRLSTVSWLACRRGRGGGGLILTALLLEGGGGATSIAPKMDEKTRSRG